MLHNYNIYFAVEKMLSVTDKLVSSASSELARVTNCCIDWEVGQLNYHTSIITFSLLRFKLAKFPASLIV